MKLAFIVSLILSTSFILSQTTRGRVKIHDGTLVTDRGTLLRGAIISTDNSDYIPSEEEIISIKKLGLNSIHLYAECTANSDSAGQKYVAVDSIVNMTERDSLYLVITIGGCGEEGTFDSTFVNEFWNFYAPRYKDKTHVIYEIMNEPFAWSAPYDSLTLLKERRAYDIIRSHAPETHILLMSYAGALNADSAIQDIKKLGDFDWGNASIASHGYQITSEELKPFLNTFINSGYAITFTEFESIENVYMNTAFTRIFEEEFVSYLHFIPVSKLVSNASVFQTLIEISEIRWIPDFGEWPASLTHINYKNPYERFKAGFYDEGLGFKLHFLTSIIGYINNEDYVAYYNYDYEDGPDSLIFECSDGNTGASNGSIELVLDSISGTSIGLYPIPYTTSWDEYKSFRFAINSHFEGVHKIFLVFRGNHPWDLMNLKSIQFKKDRINSIEGKSSLENKRQIIYPNPARDNFSLQLDENATLEIYNILGAFILRKHLSTDRNTFSINDLSPGNYIVKVFNNRFIISEILIVE